jgi:hypothetical protein
MELMMTIATDMLAKYFEAEVAILVSKEISSAIRRAVCACGIQ